METTAGSQGPVLTESMSQLREELRKVKNDLNMATGTITSLQRQMEIRESELRRIRSESEMVQKQLKAREAQLQAVSDKFCSLTEEQKQEVLMVMMGEENHTLQQVVKEQESQLAEQNKLISELQETISQLRAEVVTTRLQLLEQKRAQKEIQSQVEALQHKELQTRVALERISSKFERYRSKIIQATFSVDGSQAPPAELTDDEVLDTVQKLVNERIEFQQRLRSRGSRVSLVNFDFQMGSPALAKRRTLSRIDKTP